MRTYARAKDEISRELFLNRFSPRDLYWHITWCFLGKFPFLFIIYAYICTSRRWNSMDLFPRVSAFVCIRKAKMYKMKKSLDHVSNKFRDEISLARCWKNSSEACNGSPSAFFPIIVFLCSPCIPRGFRTRGNPSEIELWSRMSRSINLITMY